jgi:hypothetical protein
MNVAWDTVPSMFNNFNCRKHHEQLINYLAGPERNWNGVTEEKKHT